MSVDLRQQIGALFDELWRDERDDPPPELSDDTVLLETGLDSMAFAVLVARLDEELGLDPFSDSKTAHYPRTFGEFVAFYQRAS